MHALARLEAYVGLGGDIDFGSGSRVASLPSFPPLHGKGTEVTQLNSVAGHECLRDASEDRVHDGLNVSGVEVRVLGRDTVDKHGSDHGIRNHAPALGSSKRGCRGGTPSHCVSSGLKRLSLRCREGIRRCQSLKRQFPSLADAADHG